MALRPDTFLIDLDGTLIDHFAVIHRTYVHTMREMGRPAPTPEQVRAAVGGGLPNAMRRFVPEADLERALGIYRDCWKRTMLDGVLLMPGGRELLTDLRARGAKLAVLTNKHGPSSRQICDHLGVTPLLDAIVGADDTPWLKPDPKLTAHALGLLGSSADRSVMVGDSPYDVETALRSKLLAWCVSTGTHTADQLRAAGANEVFADLDGVRRRALASA